MKRHCKKESRAVAEKQSGSGQGKGSDTSEFGGREPEEVFTGPEYVFLLCKRSLMKNKNKTTVSSYLILQILASCWPSEAGGLMHSHSGSKPSCPLAFWLGLYYPQCHYRQELWNTIWNDRKEHRSDGNNHKTIGHEKVIIREKERSKENKK